MNLLDATDRLLRGQRDDASALRPRHLLALLVGAGFLYGLVLGCHNLRSRQMLYSALKVPLLLTASSLVCLPNFFVVNTLLGLRDDFAIVLRGLLSAQAVMAVALASLAPLTALAYVSSASYPMATVFNGLMFLVAALASQACLGRIYAPLIAARPRHRIGKASWLLLYLFVTIQLAWMLRPFIGAPGLPVTFFREGAWSNAYVVVSRAVWSLLVD